MNYKTEMTGNNAMIQELLSTLAELPNKEDVQNGAYAWKKFDYGPLYLTNPSITLVQNDSSYTGHFWYDITGISDDIINAIDVSFFEGFSNGTVKMQVDTDNELKLVNISTGTVLDVYLEYLPETKQIYANGNLGTSTVLGANLNYNYEGVKTIAGLQNKGEFIEYVVNDTETAYPDGGLQNGYWYEKVYESICYTSDFTPAQEIDVSKPSSYGTIANPFNKIFTKLSILCIDISRSAENLNVLTCLNVNGDIDNNNTIAYIANEGENFFYSAYNTEVNMTKDTISIRGIRTINRGAALKPGYTYRIIAW